MSDHARVSTPASRIVAHLGFSRSIGRPLSRGVGVVSQTSEMLGKEDSRRRPGRVGTLDAVEEQARGRVPLARPVVQLHVLPALCGGAPRELRKDRVLYSSPEDPTTQQERVHRIAIRFDPVQDDADEAIVAEPIGYPDRQARGVLLREELFYLFLITPDRGEVELVRAECKLRDASDLIRGRAFDQHAQPESLDEVVQRASGAAEFLAIGTLVHHARPVPVLFGLGVILHLRRHRARYDVVHTASFPYFSLLAAGAAQARDGFRIVVDWHEVWTRDYWREYAGRVGGGIGWHIQRACLRVPQRAFCFSRLHERRLRDLGLRGELTRLEGQYAGPPPAAAPEPARPVVVFAGRHIPEKRVPALVPALAAARREIADLRGEIYGDGPEREDVVRAIAAQRLDGAVTAPGFVASDVLERALASALCLVLPSRREGYGLVVVEAAARGVPVVVVEGPDNAATELVEEGVNGAVAPTAAPRDLAAAIVRINDAGPALRASTIDWFRRNAGRLSLERSVERVLETYAGD